jgi:hypothetical protein
MKCKYCGEAIEFTRGKAFTGWIHSVGGMPASIDHFAEPAGHQEKDSIEARRYRWLREHLEFIKWEGAGETLTYDTCDVGLDHAIDSHIMLLTN